MERSKMRHDRLWAAIDAIASRHGLTPSGLARRAGLDATAFNKSKRFTGDGRPRWPSTESIAKILAATQSDLADLVRLMDGHDADRLPPPTAPRDVLADLPAGFHDDGLAGSTGDDRLRMVSVDDGRMLPLYRPGDVLVVSPEAALAPGDRVVLCIDDGACEARTFHGSSAAGLHLGPLAGTGAVETVATARVSRLARILWVSQ